MNFYYNGTDILPQMQLNACVMRDRAGGEADGLSAVFADPQGLWVSWGAKRGDTVRLVDGNFDSGDLYVDDPQASGGYFKLEAVSVPPQIRRPRTKIWRDVRLSEIISDVSARAGVGQQVYDIEDYYYTTISQRAETDMAFLARICMREGYAVKVTGKTLVVYAEQAMEATPPAASVTKEQTAPAFDFYAGTGLLSTAQVRCYSISAKRMISQTASDSSVVGGERIINEICTTDGEAQRWAYGYLRAANKNARLGRIQLLQQTNYAAGSTVNLEGFNAANNGAWFVYGVDQDAVNARTTLLLRRPLAY